MGFHALVRAAANRFRFGADVPKQYLLLNGKPVISTHSSGCRRILVARPRPAQHRGERMQREDHLSGGHGACRRHPDGTRLTHLDVADAPSR
jgi:hypothetical protein